MRLGASMVKGMIAGLAGALAVAGLGYGTAWAGGHAAAAPRVIFVPGAAGSAGPPGTLAELQLDVLDTPPEATSGPLTPGAVIGKYRARARDAVVLTSEVSLGFANLPAGTVLAKVVILANASAMRTVWCDMRPPSILFKNEVLCLRDSTGKGMFDEAFHGYPAMGFSPLTIGWVESGLGRVITPASYRAAGVDERPVTQIGYRFCARDSDGQKLPYRFTDVLFQPGLGWQGAPFSCAFGDWPNPSDKSLISVDRIKIRVTGAGKDAQFQVIDGLAPGPIAGLKINGPIRSPDAPRLADIQRAEARASRALIPTGVAEALITGVHQRGDVIAQVPVVHGVTGVLKNDVVRPGLLGGEHIPAGQYVYGVPMSSQTGEERLTWCAPQAKAGNPNQFSTTCFMPVGDAYRWVLTFEPLMPAALSANAAGYPALGVNVEKKPGSLGAPMKLTYVFAGWRTYHRASGPTLAANVDVQMDVNGDRTPFGRITILPSLNGVFPLPIQNGLVNLTPLDKAGAPITQPKAGATIDEMKAVIDTADKDHVHLDVVVTPTRSEGALPFPGTIDLNVIVPTKPVAPATAKAGA